MARPLREEEERWEDPIVAEVRKVREELFARAGYDLDELCRQLREQQQKEGRQVVTRPPRRLRGQATGSAVPVRPTKPTQPPRRKPARG